MSRIIIHNLELVWRSLFAVKCTNPACVWIMGRFLVMLDDVLLPAPLLYLRAILLYADCRYQITQNVAIVTAPV